MTPRDHVVLYVNGRRHAVAGEAVFRPLSEFLRTTCGLTGTKVVCAEGDCGSCSVLIGRPRGGQIEYQPITSCIQYLAQLDATHIITVEGLQRDGRLSPVQTALADHHGSQCGFCTPGIAIALAAHLDENPRPTRHATCRALVGNLCRCTGYAPILDAAEQIDPQTLQPLRELYPDSELAADLHGLAAQPLNIAAGGCELFKPTNLTDALAYKAARPGCAVLAGGTDLGVAWNKGRRDLASLLVIGELAQLRTLTVENGTLIAGGATTLDELEAAAREVLPPLADRLARFGSPPIKSAGTLGGNIANGSPIGDTMPTLFVLNAELELASSTGTRRVNINQFYTGYRQSVMRPDELIARVIVPLPAAGELFRVYKVSKRSDLDIATFAAAIWLQVAGDFIVAARIAYAGVAPTIVRLPQTEAWLSERRLTEATLRQAGRLARGEIHPISDVRGSAEYRALLAENILLKFACEVLADRAPAGESA
ncbi:MAG: FAD binding domain-containing protein [Pirellulaceae bacterium]|nr:FAD binding domain-containing protein [Pirellulaceae bacterium]